jgi:L-seryl-tRNA(Ser) seleniumtransferase
MYRARCGWHVLKGDASALPDFPVCGLSSTWSASNGKNPCTDMEKNEHPARQLPSIEVLLERFCNHPRAAGLSRSHLVSLLRSVVAGLRSELILDGGRGSPPEIELQGRIERALRVAAGPFYRRAINATGIILHTGLGRAVLPEAAVEQISAELRGYSILQQDAETGERDRRDTGVEQLLQLLTGAEAATVVNNNAAATMIALSSLAKGREVIVSRGQLIEIGGSFRLPDVMAASGAQMVEVGTTNKTHLRDYQSAISERTGAIISVHPSNYRIHGFTKSVPTRELVALAKPLDIPVIDDLGAGALIDFSRFGFDKEPTVQESILSGADIVLSSADKLIGGPQGGLIFGTRKLIGRIRKDPLARIVRVDKITLAALEATLRIFLDEERAMATVPTLVMLQKSVAELEIVAERMVSKLGNSLACGLGVESEIGFMGGGSLPEQELPTRLVMVHPYQMNAGELASALRQGAPPIFTRIRRDAVLIDPRTLLDGEEDEIVTALFSLLKRS